ncbi:HAMP domain-containing histidine kinase [Colwellia sp. D2M02]|nr:HAMP domain-containing sensor histidine kinase [Colwellia sp. D2M02]MBU2893834.1 HAMP domain-containing histidine kinase [Colwellia sp. D2M02]
MTSFTTYPAKMSQVFTNIISNSAVHAFEANEESNEGKIIISAKVCNDILSINISDNGQGMTDEVKSHIFEPFYTTKRGKGGTGLGLSIVHNIIKNNLNGEFKVESTLGKGTCFNLELPSLSNINKSLSHKSAV